MDAKSFIPGRQELSCTKCEFKIDLPEGTGILLTETDPKAPKDCDCEDCYIDDGQPREEVWIEPCGYRDRICRFGNQWYEGSITRETMIVSPDDFSCECDGDFCKITMFHQSIAASLEIRKKRDFNTSTMKYDNWYWTLVQGFGLFD